jgi:hypothetical protein
MNTVTPCNHYLIRVGPLNARAGDSAKTMVLMQQPGRRFFPRKFVISDNLATHTHITPSKDRALPLRLTAEWALVPVLETRYPYFR